MERSSISLEENEDNLRTMTTISSLDNMYKTYLPQILGTKLKKPPISILKNRSTEGSNIPDCRSEPSRDFPNADSTTTLQNFQAKQQAYNVCAPLAPLSKNELQKRVTNLFEPTCMRTFAAVPRAWEAKAPHVRISSGQISAPVCSNTINYVTFAEPETRNTSFSDCEFSSPSPLSQSEVQSESDLDIDCCCCCQNSYHLDPDSITPAPTDVTTSSNFSCVTQQQSSNEDPCPSFSFEDIADSELQEVFEAYRECTTASQDFEAYKQSTEKNQGVEDFESYKQMTEESQDLQDRGLKMPDPEICKSSAKSLSTSSPVRTSSGTSSGTSSCSRCSDGSSIGSESPCWTPTSACSPPQSTACFPSPDPCCTQSNYLDINSFLRSKQQRCHQMPTCESYNDMLQSQTVYMTDYRPILSLGNQFTDTFNGGCCRDMPLGCGVAAGFFCFSDPCPINPWDNDCLPSVGCPPPCTPNHCCLLPPRTPCCEGQCNDMCGGRSTGIYEIGGICNVSPQCCYQIGHLSPGYCCNCPCGAQPDAYCTQPSSYGL